MRSLKTVIESLRVLAEIYRANRAMTLIAVAVNQAHKNRSTVDCLKLN